MASKFVVFGFDDIINEVYTPYK